MVVVVAIGEVSVHHQMNGKDAVHHNRPLLKHKEEEKTNKMLPFVKTWMEPEDIMLSEISQIETNTSSFHLYTCMPAQWTIACQAPRLWDSPGKNTGVGCLFKDFTFRWNLKNYKTVECT